MKNKTKKKSSNAKYFIIGAIIVAIILILVFVSRSKTSYSRDSIDNFAKCLTEKGVKMYGTFWCPKCAEQKKMFGSSFQFINYVECDARGENEQSELCIEKDVQKYPDWEFADNSRVVGITSFEYLGAKAGCPAPQ